MTATETKLRQQLVLGVWWSHKEADHVGFLVVFLLFVCLFVWVFLEECETLWYFGLKSS